MTRFTPARRFALVAVLVLGLGLPVLAQFGRRYIPAASAPVAYNGSFVIVRLWYPRYPGWSYDYPEMEQNFTLILKDISLLPAHPNGSNIFRMDDPELLKFPVAYLSEPGYWYPSESEALGLRTYLAKGGFLIVDDFGDYMEHSGNGWYAVDPTNEAFKFGVNYLIYGMTH